MENKKIKLKKKTLKNQFKNTDKKQNILKNIQKKG